MQPSQASTTAGKFAYLVVKWLMPQATPPTVSGWSTATNANGTLNTIVTALYGVNYYCGTAIFYLENIPGGTLNPTVSGVANSGFEADLVVYDGLPTSGTFDKVLRTDSAGNVTGSQTTGNTASTTQANELVVEGVLYGVASGSSNATIGTATSGYTLVRNSGAGNVTDMPSETSSKEVSSTGAQSATWTLGSYSGQFFSAIATFKMSGGATVVSLTTASLQNLAKSTQSRLAPTFSTASLRATAQSIQARIGVALSSAAMTILPKQLSNRLAISTTSQVLNFDEKSIQNRSTIAILNGSIENDSNALQLATNTNLGTASLSFLAKTATIFSSKVIELSLAVLMFVSDPISIGSEEAFQILRRGRSRFRTLFNQ